MKRLWTQIAFIRRFSANTVTQPNLRNVGILAHIDAGKTTLTEKLLFLTGRTTAAGDVDDGNTVMDYLQLERERGITINSACTSIFWKDNQINIIDTPGHVDFTFEVERSLSVLDSVILVLDGLRGVESQTKTVFNQAVSKNKKFIAFVNKLDRVGSSYEKAARSLETEFVKSDVVCLLMQLPVFALDLDGIDLPDKAKVLINNGVKPGVEDFERLIGVVNLMDLSLNIFDTTGTSTGVFEHILTPSIVKNSKDSFQTALVSARKDLLEALQLLDENFPDFKAEEVMTMGTPIIFKSLQSVVRNINDFCVIPVFCGSAARYIGMHPLLQAIADFAPTPQGYQFEDESALLIRIFKLQYDKQRGLLSFGKVIAGNKFPKGNVVSNISQTAKFSERIGKILRVNADNYEIVDENDINVGDVFIFTGLKKTGTGDYLVANLDFKSSVVQEVLNNLDTVNIPEPVFSASIECPKSELDFLLKSLQLMTRDDPSLRYHFDEEMDQFVVSGMGELHLQVAENKLRTEYNMSYSFGDLKVAYRETLLESIDSSILRKTIEKDSEQSDDENEEPTDIELDLRLVPSPGINDYTVSLITSSKNQSNISEGSRQVLLDTGKAIMKRGPMKNAPFRDVELQIHLDSSIIPADAKQVSLHQALTQQLLRLFSIYKEKSPSPFQVLEPFGILRVEVGDLYLGDVLSHISGSLEQAEILDVVDIGETTKQITARVKLSTVMKYNSVLRSLTKGEGASSTTYEKYMASL